MYIKSKLTKNRSRKFTCTARTVVVSDRLHLSLRHSHDGDATWTRIRTAVYSSYRMSVLTMMLTTIDICLYVYLSSNECSYYDFNDDWYVDELL